MLANDRNQELTDELIIWRELEEKSWLALEAKSKELDESGDQGIDISIEKKLKNLNAEAEIDIVMTLNKILQCTSTIKAYKEVELQEAEDCMKN